MAGEKSVFKWVWVPISRVIGLQALLDGGLSSANPTFTGTVSLPPTTDVEYDNVTLDALLAAKQNIGINSVAAPNSALQLSYFDNNAQVYLEKDANFAFTFADDLKTKQEFRVRVFNSHASALITITQPTASNYILQRGLTTVSLLAGEYVEMSFIWDGTNWRITYGEAMMKNA
jgi:hypothetical protein